jgi:hypothetical protein
MPDKKETLIFVAKKLNETKTRWFLIAGFNLELQGMSVAPGDIDIVVSFSDKEKVKKLFETEKLIRSTVLRNKEVEDAVYLIKGSEVQFCFEYPHGFYSQFLRDNKFLKVKLGAVEIFCNLLENEIKAYEYLGRKEKAEKIRKFLKK